VVSYGALDSPTNPAGSTGVLRTAGAAGGVLSSGTSQCRVAPGASARATASRPAATRRHLPRHVVAPAPLPSAFATRSARRQQSRASFAPTRPVTPAPRPLRGDDRRRGLHPPARVDDGGARAGCHVGGPRRICPRRRQTPAPPAVAGDRPDRRRRLHVAHDEADGSYTSGCLCRPSGRQNSIRDCGRCSSSSAVIPVPFSSSRETNASDISLATTPYAHLLGCRRYGAHCIPLRALSLFALSAADPPVRPIAGTAPQAADLSRPAPGRLPAFPAGAALGRLTVQRAALGVPASPDG